MNDCDLFMKLEESLKVVEQCLCGRCMSIHAISRTCHHPGSLVHVTHGTWKAESHIVGIVKLCTTNFDNLIATGALFWMIGCYKVSLQTCKVYLLFVLLSLKH